MQEKVSIMCSWCGWENPSLGLRAARRWLGKPRHRLCCTTPEGWILIYYNCLFFSYKTVIACTLPTNLIQMYVALLTNVLFNNKQVIERKCQNITVDTFHVLRTKQVHSLCDIKFQQNMQITKIGTVSVCPV